MPYSALHAMMCCHTNESDLLPPFLPFFLDHQRVSFSLISSFIKYDFPNFFSTFFFLSVINVPGLRVNYRDWLDTERWKECPWIACKRERKERKYPESKHRWPLIYITFFVPSFRFGPAQETSSFVMYKTERCKIKKQPYVLMKWKIIYSDLFWDQLLSCWAWSTVTFEGKGLTYSPLVSYVFSVLHTESTHQYFYFYKMTSECWQHIFVNIHMYIYSSGTANE